MNKRAYKAWFKEVVRLYTIMNGKAPYVTYKESALIEFWFEHNYTEGKAVQLMAEYNI